MYKKVELKNGFVGMETEVPKTWSKKDIIKNAIVEGKKFNPSIEYVKNRAK